LSKQKVWIVGYILSGEEGLVIFARDSLLHSLNQCVVELILKMNKVLAVILHCDTDCVHRIAVTYPITYHNDSNKYKTLHQRIVTMILCAIGVHLLTYSGGGKKKALDSWCKDSSALHSAVW